MSEHIPNSPNAPKAGAPHAVRKLDCEEWEAMLVDFLDGALPSKDAESFHGHQETCASCAEMYSQARQGREWLNFLRVEPPVSPVLLPRILAQTSGTATHAHAGVEAASASAMPIPVAAAPAFWQRAGIASASRRVAQPRLMMTAAMAFFSITLTMNMAGVKLSTIRISDLKPTTLANNVDKQYHMASARVVRYYDNLRFVYEMEAKVREMRRDADLNNAPVEKQDQPEAPDIPQNGNHKNGGKSEGPSNPAPQARLWGEKVEAELRQPGAVFEGLKSEVEAGAPQDSNKKSETADIKAADQAERGMA
jgi:hypothetical protein